MKKVLSLLLILIMMLSAIAFVSTLSASALENVKGKTIAEVLGMDVDRYMNWLTSHEKDKYYLGTPYVGFDHRNPTGDCKGAYGSLDTRGKAAMNCIGFVWHALYKPTKASGGKTSLIPTMTGWVSFYRYYNVSHRYFSSINEMLNSGYLEKG
ncbi:MAG: hypothetical protein IJU73_02170, partial [Ruminococcus sp.]|nr:hypothetical protein [Ruminococcus sp.]